MARRTVNYEVTSQASNEKNVVDFSASEQLGSVWLDIEIPEDHHKKSWRYFVYDRYAKEDVSGEYKQRQEALEAAKLMGSKQYTVRSWEPSVDELSQMDAEIRTEKRYNSGFGG